MVQRTRVAGGLLVLALVAFWAVACNATQGSGNVKTETRTVAGFSKVAVEGSGTLHVDQTGTESLAVQAEDNLLPKIQSSVSNGALTIGPKDNVSINPTKPINYNLTVRDLRALDVLGSATASGQHLSTSSLAVTITGSGNVSPAGTATDQNVTISGSGAYLGKQLQGATGQVTTSGSGETTVNVSDSLNATINGSGTVRYLGTPRVSKQINGDGSVEPA
jgi:hypothetical protein